MTPIGEFPGGASLDLLFPHIVTKLGDDLIYSEEWRLLALKNLVSKSMEISFTTMADVRASIIVHGELRTEVDGLRVVVERSPPFRRMPVRLVGAALASYLNTYLNTKLQEVFHIKELDVSITLPDDLDLGAPCGARPLIPPPPPPPPPPPVVINLVEPPSPKTVQRRRIGRGSVHVMA